MNHLLKFTRIGVKGNLPRQRQILLLDDLSTLVQAKRFQTKLPIFFYSLFHSLPLLFLKIFFWYRDNVPWIDLGIDHIDRIDVVPPSVPKDVLMQKWICKHKGLIPESISKACQSIWPVNRQGWRYEHFGPDNSDTPGSHGQEVLTRNSRITEWSHWSDATRRINENS